MWRPGNSAQIAYRNRLIDVDAGATVLEFPGTIVEWTADGTHALLGVEEQGPILGHHFVLFDLRDSNFAGIRFYLNTASCECDVPNWEIGRGDVLLSPRSSYVLLKETDDRLATPGVERLVGIRDETTLQHLPTLGGIPSGFSPDDKFVLVWNRSGNVADEPAAEVVAIWVVDVGSSEITFLAKGRFPAWQPTAA